MDITTPPQTHNWELLAHLALCGQDDTLDQELAALVRHLASLLHQYDLASWGMVLVSPADQPAPSHADSAPITASWGLSASKARRLRQANGRLTQNDATVFPLRSNQRDQGYLLLPHEAADNGATHTLVQAVTAQIGLLLGEHQQRHQSPPPTHQPDMVTFLGDLAAVNASTFSASILLEEICDRLPHILPIDQCVITMYNPEHREITLTFTATASEHRLVSEAYPPPAEGLIKRLLRQPAVLTADDVAALLPALRLSAVALPDAACGLSVPLTISDKHSVGIVVLLHRMPQRYSAREQALLTAASHQIALGIQRIQLWEQTEEQVVQLSLLNGVSAVAASSGDLYAIYKAVVDAMVQVTGADQARLVMYDRRQGVGMVLEEYIPTDNRPSYTMTLKDDAALAWLDENLAPLVSYDAQHDRLFVRSHGLFRQFDIRSVALVPLILDHQVVGVVVISFEGRQMHFRAQQLEFCQTIANHVATVIEKDRLFAQAQQNARALQVKVGELSTLLEAAGMLGALLRPTEVLTSLMDLVSRQLRVTTVALWTIDDEHVLRPNAIYGIPNEALPELRVPIGRGLTGKVAETGLPLILHDISASDITPLVSYSWGEQDLTSFMGVPVFYRDQVIGVLSVMSHDRREFTSDEMMILIGLASQAAIALENARLFQERERRISELTTINNIGLAMTETLEMDELLMTLHRGISGVLDTRCSFIGLYEEARIEVADSQLRLRLLRNGDEPYVSDRVLLIDGKHLVDYVLLKGEPLLLHNQDEILTHIRDWTTWQPEQIADTTQVSPIDAPFACWLGVPIVQGDTVLGIIGVQSSEANQFTNDDVRFLSTVAGQAAAAIDNARLFQERERRLRELSVLKEIGTSISSTMDLSMVLERLRYELGQALDVSTSMLGLYDRRTETLNYLLCFDRGKRMHVEPTRLSNDVNSWVVRNSQPLLLHNVDQARRIGFEDFGFSLFDVRSAHTGQRVGHSLQAQSFLVVPILASEGVLGVINVQSYEPHAFDQDDLRFVTTVAHQVAVTIANIQLFTERGRRIDELSTFNEIGRALSATVSIEDLPDLIYRQTSRLLDTTNFYMALINEERGEVQFPLFFEQGVNYQIPAAPDQSTSREGEYRSPRAPVGVSRWALITYLTQQVIDTAEPLLFQGSDLDHHWTTELREFHIEVRRKHIQKPQSWLGVPMIVADKVVGVVAIQSYEDGHAYGADETRLLSTIASSAGIALENARLFEQISNLASELEQRVTDRTTELEEANRQLLEEKEGLETVHAITLELTASLDLDEIICRALEMASTNLGVARGSIMMRDTQSGSLVCRAMLHDQGIVHSANLPISFNNGAGLANWVIQHQQAISIADVRLDTRWVVEAGRADEARSVIAVPLMTSDTTIGVLVLSSPYTSYFTDSQLRLLETIAHEVAIAINNAQLYTYITEMAGRLAELLDRQKEETSKSRAILQSMTEGVIVIDVTERIAVFNPAAEHILAIPAGQVLDQPVEVILNLADNANDSTRERVDQIYEMLERGLSEAKERGGIYSTTIELSSPTQTIALNFSSVMAIEGRLYGNVAVLRDITAEIEADRTKRMLVSRVSHELKTPLTAMTGHIDLVMLGIGGPITDQQREMMTVVKNNARRLRALVEDILSTSEIDAGKIKLTLAPVAISAVIQDVITSLRLEAEKKRQEVTVEIEPDLPMIEADEQRVIQIFTNLFSNAIKYTFDEGHISVQAFLNPARLLQVEVCDTGVGISPEQQKQLFRPFYRADNPLKSAGGTGLGLSIARSLVEHHSGNLWVESEPGKGSTFCFVLPLEQPQPDAAPDKEHAT